MNEPERKKLLNELAWEFYEAHGYVHPNGEHDFSTAKHPQERLMFALAEMAFMFLEDREMIAESFL